MDRKEIEEKVLSDINFTYKSLDEGVEHLIQWIHDQPHLPNVTDKELIKAFIVASKSTEKAKERLNKYYTVRTKYPVCFADRDPKQINWASTAKLVRLPGITPKGHVVYLIPEMNEEIANLFNYVEFIKVTFMMLDRLYRTDPIISGQYLIHDCKNLPMQIVLKCFKTLSFLPASFNIYQNSLPIRFKGLICINASSVAEYMVNYIFKVFFNKKLRERISVYSEDHTVLSKYIPMEMLPSDYGGSSPSVQQLMENRNLDLENDRDWFLSEGNIGADKSKKIKKLKNNNNNEQTVQNQLKNLDID